MELTPADPFLAACGASTPLVFAVKHPMDPGSRRPVTHAIAQPFVIVGRLPQAQICLDDPEVSERHAYLQLIGGRLYGVDLGSRTGTFLAGNPFQRGWIEHAQGLRIGPFQLRLHSASPHGAEGPSHEDGAAAPAGSWHPASPHDDREPVSARFEIAVPGGRSRIWNMSGLLALAGRGEHCRLRLQHDRVARYHCSLVRTPDGVWAVDLRSRWRTACNGTALGSRRLLPGDRLSIGPFSIRLLESKPVQAARTVPEASRRATTPHGAIAQLAPTQTAGERAAWLPAATATVASTAMQALATDAASRLDALERRQDAMQDHFQQALMMMLQAFGAMHREQRDMLTSELSQVRRLSEAIDGLRAELNGQLGSAAGRGATARPAADPAAPEPSVREPLREFGTHEPEASRVRRDPREVHALVSERLAAFERERQSRWTRILSSLTRPS